MLTTAPISGRSAFLLAFFWLALTANLALAGECKEGVAQAVSVQGQLEVLAAGATNWQPAALGDSFCPGDRLRVGANSRAGLTLNDDTLLRLAEHSSVVISAPAGDGTAWLDLMEGIAHFISRIKHAFQVNTPYVNASIEGTEFIVQIQENATEVTVYEGLVVASNKQGSVKIGPDQTGRAVADQAPVRIANANPRDAVAWALYYPPLPLQPGAADTLAQQTITAIAQNRLAEAVELARQSLAADPHSAAAYMAQSYVDQAQFNIADALMNSRKSAELAPQSALTQARLAEVWLMTGDTGSAREAATLAVSLDPQLSLAHTVLGFSSLRQINLDGAKRAFETAIRLDSAAPLPRLGLGLLLIRQGELESGRREIETAVLLDPNNALLRSYMGKTYYEEKRIGLASDQLAMAKTLDPNDPTAWFYDSVLLQSDNRPVEALQAQARAIELNDHRGVYRSRQLLDQDEASRNAALGRIYNDLSFEQQAHNQAIGALLQDPGNHSAHRLLADSYTGITNRDAARQSELLQSKLTQPLNLDPLQPQLSNSNFGLLDGNGPADLSYNEYNPLFTRNGMALQLDASVAEHGSWSNDAIVAGLFDRLAFSVGQYHTETEQLQTDNSYEQDILSGIAHLELTENSAIQLELSHSKEQKGDVAQRLLPEFLINNDLSIESETSTARIGFRQSLASDVNLLVNAIRKHQDFNSTDDSDPFLSVQTDREKTIGLYETQIIGKQPHSAWLAGASRQKQNVDSSLDVTFLPPLSCPFPSCVFPAREDLSQTRLYGYFFYQAGQMLNLTGGMTLLDEKNEIDDDMRKAYPKLGLKITPNPDDEVRIAAFRNRGSVILPSLYETLEPTHIAGFNQLYDDIDQTDSKNYAAAYQHKFSSALQAGASSTFRKLNTRINILDTSTPFPESSIQSLDYDDRYANLWFNWTPSALWSLSLEYAYNRYDLEEGLKSSNSAILAPDGILKLTTHRLPATLNYFHPLGIISTLKVTYYDQEGQFIDASGTEIQEGEDTGVITDLSLSYRFPKRQGSVSIGVKNLFDTQLNYEDRNSYDIDDPASTASPSSFSGERVIYGKVSLNFR